MDALDLSSFVRHLETSKARTAEGHGLVSRQLADLNSLIIRSRDNLLRCENEIRLSCWNMCSLR